MKLIKIPFSEAGLGRTVGTEKAPDKIVEDLKDMHMNESYRRQQYDTIDVDIVSNNISENNSRIEKEISNVCERIKGTRERAVIIGGDHSITYATFKGFAKQNPGAGLVLIDAHPDLLPEAGIQSHEDYLRMLINEGVVSKDRLVIAGIRNTDVTEKEFMDAHRIRAFTMSHIYNEGISDFCDGLMETVRNWPSFYLSIDIDAADPSCAPGTGYLEPGGFSSLELIYIVRRLGMLKNLGMMDIVEVNPDKDINGMTSKLAAKIIKELE
jgi:arginase family enzyme